MKHRAKLGAAALLAAAWVSTAADLPTPTNRAVDFQSDIAPIFAERCVSCHGAEKQKGGYRLDVKVSALTGGDNFAPNIHPGKSAESPLIHFVAGLDPDMKMPGKGEPLTAAQIGLLRAWIDQGAEWPDDGKKSDPLDWWSLRPLPRNGDFPITAAQTGAAAHSNPIDAFIRAKLAEKGLQASPEADSRTLIRRLFFDLLGLPPTPEEVEAFTRDGDPQAYEKLIEHLLASPHYGERWARHWLDVAHYGDSHGYDKDQPRPNAWPYRDYVIRAFNEDKPYARFVQEQLAGDVLFPGTRDGIEALGFIAAGPWDLIGHMEVPETKIDGQIARNLDRDDMVANTFNTFCSLTVQCARCHNHKFDPVSQVDYYGLQAVFAALDRADKKYDVDPAVAAERAALTSRQKVLSAEHDRMRKAGIMRAGDPLAVLDGRLAALEKPQPGQASKADAYGYHSKIEPTAGVTKWVQVDLGKTTALSRVVLHPCRDSFNNIGDGFGFPVRFKIEISEDANFASGVTRIADHAAVDFPNPKIAPVSQPVNGQRARYIRVTATQLAPRQNDFIFALAELAAFDVVEQNVATSASVTALDSIEAAPRWRRANLTDGYFPGANRAGDPEELARLREEREKLIESALGDDERRAFTAAAQQSAEFEGQLAALPAPSAVYAGTIHKGSGAFTGTGPNGGQPRIIRVLHRGDVQNPKQVVLPGTVPLGGPGRFELPEGASEGERRAALARWITASGNPLTWRSIVNRVWQYHFGRALADSPNDFGRMGQPPSHPELLDWLAADFRDHGQSFKRLHRLILTSATYRQSAAGNVAAEKLDSGNALLWRMNRRKLDAESIRDAVLAVSGKLDRTLGGPGFQDFAIEKPEHSPHYKYLAHDPNDPRAHRRSIYRFIVRSQPQPFMSALDCADPSMSVDKRNETMTPLQALALLNNRLMLTMSGHFATRLRESGGDVPRQIEQAFRLALARSPSTGERDELAAYARQHGLANACRVIFNLNEFVFVD